MQEKKTPVNTARAIAHTLRQMGADKPAQFAEEIYLKPDQVFLEGIALLRVLALELGDASDQIKTLAHNHMRAGFMLGVALGGGKLKDSTLEIILNTGKKL